MPDLISPIQGSRGWWDRPVRRGFDRLQQDWAEEIAMPLEGVGRRTQTLVTLKQMGPNWRMAAALQRDRPKPCWTTCWPFDHAALGSSQRLTFSRWKGCASLRRCAVCHQTRKP